MKERQKHSADRVSKFFDFLLVEQSSRSSIQLSLQAGQGIGRGLCVGGVVVVVEGWPAFNKLRLQQNRAE